MKALYFGAKNEIKATYDDVATISYVDIGQNRDTIIVAARLDGNPMPTNIAFIRLNRGERVEYRHEYVQDKGEKLPNV